MDKEGIYWAVEGRNGYQAIDRYNGKSNENNELIIDTKVRATAICNALNKAYKLGKQKQLEECRKYISTI